MCDMRAAGQRILSHRDMWYNAIEYGMLRTAHVSPATITALSKTIVTFVEAEWKVCCWGQSQIRHLYPHVLHIMIDMVSRSVNKHAWVYVDSMNMARKRNSVPWSFCSQWMCVLHHGQFHIHYLRIKCKVGQDEKDRCNSINHWTTDKMGVNRPQFCLHKCSHYKHSLIWREFVTGTNKYQNKKKSKKSPHSTSLWMAVIIEFGPIPWIHSNGWRSFLGIKIIFAEQLNKVKWINK